MLLDALRELLGVREGGTAGADATSAAPADGTRAAPGVDPLHLAACVLLLEVAWADGEFTVEERAHLEDVLERHFDLPPDAGRRLMALAEEERRSATDYHQFTRVLKDEYDLGQKMVLAEVLWGLVMADGRVAEHEQYLTRKIANLLDLKPGFLAAARKAVAEGEG